MQTYYRARPLPAGRAYASFVEWMPELEDWVMIVVADPEQARECLSDPETVELPYRFCEAVQNGQRVPPAPKLRSVA